MYDANEECEKVIEKIKFLCELKSISYHAVSVKAEISSSTMHSLMSGKTKPYLHTLYKICNALDVRMDEIICDNIAGDKKDKLNQKIYSEEQKLLVFYHAFSDRKKSMLIDYVEMLKQYDLVE